MTGAQGGRHWETQKSDPTCQDLRAVMYGLDPGLSELHLHTKQAVADDLLDAALGPERPVSGVQFRRTS